MEAHLVGYPSVVSYDTKKIIEQMEKDICKIRIGGMQGTWFFCRIPYIDKLVLIANNHVINKNVNEIKIKIKDENESRRININDRIKYFNEEYDIAIIELKYTEINNYLELDDNIINDIINNNNINEEYIDETVYIIQYP